MHAVISSKTCTKTNRVILDGEGFFDGMDFERSFDCVGIMLSQNRVVVLGGKRHSKLN